MRRLQKEKVRQRQRNLLLVSFRHDLLADGIVVLTVLIGVHTVVTVLPPPPLGRTVGDCAVLQCRFGAQVSLRNRPHAGTRLTGGSGVRSPRCSRWRLGGGDSIRDPCGWRTGGGGASR